MSILGTIVNVILLPVYLVVFVIVMVIWGVFTFTGIGPLFQYFCYLSDKKTLDRDLIAETNSDIRIINIPGGVHACSDDKPYNVFAIFSQPKVSPSKYPPVCIPNGLGATAVLIGQMQERLVELGFTVLSFDRLGVGLSDENRSGQAPTAVDLVKEMDYIMNAVQPADTKWILLGPSMGSIIAQCYLSAHPDRIVGFLNMDGLPYPFIKFHSAFMWAAFIYRIYASIIWTGVLRPFIGMALRSNEKMFQSSMFPLKIVIAQMNQSRFFANVGTEMWTMMDCCEMAEVAWCKLSLLALNQDQLQTLVRAPPTVSIDFDEANNARQVTTIRSESEAGSAWATAEEVASTLAVLTGDSQTITQVSAAEVSLESVAGEHSSGDPLLKHDCLAKASKHTSSSRLGEIWSKLVVRVMSARNHDFGNAVANSFYSQSMRDYAAAEHAKHTLLARNGARTIYPKLTHAVIFSKTDDIVRNIQEIAFALQDGASKE